MQKVISSYYNHANFRTHTKYACTVVRLLKAAYHTEARKESVNLG